MTDLKQPSKFTPEQIAQMKKNAADYLKRSAAMFPILKQNTHSKEQS